MTAQKLLEHVSRKPGRGEVEQSYDDSKERKTSAACKRLREE